MERDSGINVIVPVIVNTTATIDITPGMTYADALWYGFAIVTTIGFGDITATTRIGRIISVVLGAYGIIVVALITSIIVAYYGEMKKVTFVKKGSG